jgi:hypothetical protein
MQEHGDKDIGEHKRRLQPQVVNTSAASIACLHPSHVHVEETQKASSIEVVLPS